MLDESSDRPTLSCWKLMSYIAAITLLLMVTMLGRLLIQFDQGNVIYLATAKIDVVTPPKANFVDKQTGSTNSNISETLATTNSPSLPLSIKHPTKSPDDSNFVVQTASPAGCPLPARFLVSGEPELKNIWNESDAYLLAGGYNLFPGKAAYHPALISGCCRDKIFRRGSISSTGLGFKPIVNRTFADVFYRSSYCESRRENLTGIVRQKVEAAGFTFATGGYCEGAGYPKKLNFRKQGVWTTCGRECTESKIMLSFERFEQGHEYLSEKLFIPLEHGAVPAYFGNGQKILDNILKVNRRAFIDRNDFESDAAYADKIVDLLKNPQELQRIQDEAVFHDVEMARKMITFFGPLGASGEDAFPELYHVLRDNEKFKKFINGKNIKVRVSGVNVVPVLQHVLNIASVQYVSDSKACVDIETHACCARR